MDNCTDYDLAARRGAEMGISPNAATYCRVRGKFNVDVPEGSRFSLGAYNYIIEEKLEEHVYSLKCEEPGSGPNANLGEMTAISYVEGLETAVITALIEPGYDREKLESFKKRYFTKIRKPSTSGNKYDYHNWAMECDGVGAAKVFPLASGPGTVKVIIADANMSAAGTGLVREVQDHIEELRPIGADVTVASVVEKAVNVSASIKLRAGMNLGVVQDAFRTGLASYLRKEAMDMAYVSLARLGNLLLGTDGIEDYSELLLNGIPRNVTLSNEEIAVAGTVTLEVM